MKIIQYGDRVLKNENMKFHCYCGTIFVCNVIEDGVTINEDNSSNPREGGRYGTYGCPGCGRICTSVHFFYGELNDN